MLFFYLAIISGGLALVVQGVYESYRILGAQGKPTDKKQEKGLLVLAALKGALGLALFCFGLLATAS